MEKKKIQNTLAIGKVTEEEVSGLHGLVIRARETTFGVVNQNGERYLPDCMDRFIEGYFVANGLNLPLTVMHGERLEDLIGRVLSIRKNDDGYDFEAFIPDTIDAYIEIKAKIEAGLLQGLSKEGWTTDYAIAEDGVVDVKEIAVTAMSLVATPANPNVIQAEEVADALKFEKSKTENDPFA